ncbi:MAG: hypothetical protein DU429_08025 [Candidatus Tokpelaia sp.]|nr:MAG: hypothetical protein DU430_08545 [Candidatus Tokpelaia sp.]KAA6205389.1 MAG: hypothetical protein DU429_08025 [Candidatus Tokpelaia sp.]
MPSRLSDKISGRQQERCFYRFQETEIMPEQHSLRIIGIDPGLRNMLIPEKFCIAICRWHKFDTIFRSGISKK